MISQMFAVISGEDDQRVVENTAPLQLVRKRPEATIQVSYGVIINIQCHLNMKC